MTKELWLEKHGFNTDSITYCVCGDDTYYIKEELKEEGCKFDPFLKWHSSVPLDLSSDFTIVPISFDDILVWNAETAEAEYKEDAKETIEKITKAAIGPIISEYYDGAVGDRIRNITATFKSYRGFAGRYGWTNIYTFNHGDNVLVWFTAKDLELEKGQVVDFTGTIKKFEEFRGVKTTQFSRCIIKPIV